MVLAGAFAVASTARVFSGTVDEPAHLAAGMQWLTTGEYSYDLQHPPLGRIAAALGPFVHGARSMGAGAIYDEGAKILGTGAHYSETLASARHGELVFFVLLALVVWFWAKSLIGDAGAAVATLLLVANPNVLAHAGLATTDIACAATITLALFLAVRWVESPTMGRALSFGAGAALAVGSRLSALAFVGGALVVSYALYAWVERRATIERGPGSPRVSAQVGAERVALRRDDLGDLPIRDRPDAPGRRRAFRRRLFSRAWTRSFCTAAPVIRASFWERRRIAVGGTTSPSPSP